MSDQQVALGIARSHMDKLQKSLPKVDKIQSSVGTVLPRMQFYNADRESLGWMPIPTNVVEAHTLLYFVESGQYIMDIKEPWVEFYTDMLHSFSKGILIQPI